MAGGKMKRFGKNRGKPKGLTKTEKKEVKQLVRKESETKRFTFAHSAASVDYGGHILGTLTNIAQGDGYNQREGDQITLSKAILRYHFVCANTTNVLRLIIFRYKIDSATPPTVADIVTAGYVGSGNAPFAPLQFGTDREKFNVLYDKSVYLSETTHEVEGGKHTMYLKNSKVRFNAGATDGRGTIWALVISDDGAVTYPTCNFTWELFYKDV